MQLMNRRARLAQVYKATGDVISLYEEVEGILEDVLVQSSLEGVCGTHLRILGKKYFFPFATVPAVIGQRAVVSICNEATGDDYDEALGIQLLNDAGEVTMRFVHEDSEVDPGAEQLFVEDSR